MKNYFVFINLFMIIENGCDSIESILNKDQRLNGTSTFSATLNGVNKVFTIDGAGSVEIGLNFSGYTSEDTIALYLGDGGVGEYHWNIPKGLSYYDYYYDTIALYNSTHAIPGVGSATIVENNSSTNYVVGTFLFMVIDKKTKDTIKITDGKFKVYYRLE